MEVTILQIPLMEGNIELLAQSSQVLHQEDQDRASITTNNLYPTKLLKSKVLSMHLTKMWMSKV